VKFSAKKTLESRLILLGASDAGGRRGTVQDENQRRKALEDLIATAGFTEGDLDIESFTADSRSPIEWVGAACTVPFMSDYRMTVVRNVGRADPAKVWTGEKYSASHPFVKEALSLPDTGRLVLVMDDEVGDSQKMDRIEAAGGRWARLVRLAGGAVCSFEADPAQAVNTIGRAAKERGKKISRAAATRLSEMLNGQTTAALSEIDKLCLYVGDRDEIRDSDVTRLVTPEAEYSAFSLTDAIAEGSSKKALTQLRMLFSRHPRIETEVFPRVFPLLTHQFRMLWLARLCIDHNCPADKPTPEVAAMMPDKPNFAKTSDWQRRRAMRGARGLTIPQIAACLFELETADARMKGLKPAYSAQETLEEMTLKMSLICSGR
jgi:DNA polymerase III delta subunit